MTGRLAMIAIMGMFAGELVTGEQPFEVRHCLYVTLIPDHADLVVIVSFVQTLSRVLSG
jgi:prephenate dehydratase